MPNTKINPNSFVLLSEESLKRKSKEFIESLNGLEAVILKFKKNVEKEKYTWAARHLEDFPRMIRLSAEYDQLLELRYVINQAQALEKEKE